MYETAQPDASQVTETPADAVRTLAVTLTELINVARALVDSNRTVNLTGLENEIGLLCAKTLDLPQDEGRRLRPRLIALFGSLEGLSRALAAHGPPSG